MPHTSDEFLYLSEDMIEALQISPLDMADAIEEALLAKADGRLHTTPKSVIIPGRERYMMSTLAVGEDGFIVVKQVSVCPENSKRGLSAINGALMVLDAETGCIRAILGANAITAMRTAALSAVAARRLADPTSENLTLIGAGIQAHSHLEAFSELFPLKRICVLGRGKANIDKLCRKAHNMGLEADTTTDPQEALSDADMVVTSVTLDFSIKPFLDARWLKSNAFAAITDACVPWIPQSMGAFKTVIVDDLIQEAESDKPMFDRELITGDLIDLASNRVATDIGEKPATFAFRGMALGDYAAAVLTIQRAEMANIGKKVGP
ncbi:MAG: ornithine cyclodeaminase family protein [Rhizobiaceae bacterium]|nr:ornithine cyclodeaminase family protein [Rhizobiaceae bacterium]